MSEKIQGTTAQGANVPAVNPQQKLFEVVSKRITDLITEGGITTPKDYDAGNAMRSAFLMLQDMKDRNEKPVLEVCTQASIANAFMKMVVQGMNPAKSQCYFIPYGTQLNYQRSYMGSYALAKRVSDLKEVNAVLIYEGDVFSYDIDTNTGRISITEHTQKFENINIEKIKGGYAICVFSDGSTHAEIMTMAQIRKAWEQGQNKGGSPAHKNFTDEMAKKSIRSRAVKLIINSSDDSNLMDEDETPTTSEIAKEEAKTQANVVEVELPIQEAEVVSSVTNEPQQANESKESNPQGLFDAPAFA